jgi:gamma-glutamyltranspeptidase/glutathione hydrolase
MRVRTPVVLAAILSLATGLSWTAPTATAAPRQTEKQPVAVGTGGAVATVDPEASRAGIDVLRKGGNAVDAAVAAAATLGVTEPYSAGIGGGGFFVFYEAATGKVHTIDGRETAPQAMQENAFIDPETGQPIPFAEAVTSGLSVGVPGTPLTWQEALDRWGTISLRRALQPAVRVAERGFVVDEEFRKQTEENEERFRDIIPTRELFLPDGEPPEVGSVFKNHDLAQTYRLMARKGVGTLYTGEIAEEIVATVQDPPVDPAAERNVRPGLMELPDLAAYEAPLREPTHLQYRGLDVFGMGPPSSGGSTVGEALNILENFDLSGMMRTQALHHYLEASALGFADRNRYVGDSDFVDVPLDELLSDGFAKERSCEIDPKLAADKPVPPGDPDGEYVEDCPAPATAERTGGSEGLSTTHLTVADRWGNVVAYTLTIEQTGGSAITVPDRGFILNNELTDFNFAPTQGDPNLPAPGKRPRSSMSPTIVLSDGEPLVAVGSPGGSMIITTVLQTLLNRLDFGMTLPEAVAAPRASQRNTVDVFAEQAFITAEGGPLGALRHTFTTVQEIGAVAAIEFLDAGRLLAAAEPERRGGGSAMVVRPSR